MAQRANMGSQPPSVNVRQDMQDIPDIPEFRWVPVSDLQVDYEYQHRPYESAIRELHAEFVPELSGPILINIRADESIYIIDGASRREVHVLLGKRWILAEIKRGLSQQEEAKAYLVKCKNKQRQPVDWFKASVTAGDTAAVAINDILTKKDVEVISFAAERTPTGKAVLSCVAALQRIYRVDRSGEHLASVLDLVTEIWGYDRTALSGHWLETISTLLRRYDQDLIRTQFIQKFSEYKVAELQDLARALRNATHPTPTLRRAMIRKMVELYNVGRQRRLQIED